MLQLWALVLTYLADVQKTNRNVKISFAEEIVSTNKKIFSKKASVMKQCSKQLVSTILHLTLKFEEKLNEKVFQFDMEGLF